MSGGDAIRHIGTKAVPYLLNWVVYETPAWKRGQFSPEVPA